MRTLERVFHFLIKFSVAAASCYIAILVSTRFPFSLRESLVLVYVSLGHFFAQHHTLWLDPTCSGLKWASQACA